MSHEDITDRPLLGEDELRQISRNVKQHIPQSSGEGDIKKLREILESVLFTSLSPSLSPGHRVAAWNTLCALVDETFDSSNKGLEQSLWALGIWTRCFGLYIHHSHNARPKSSKQLLGSLTRILTKGEQSSEAADLKRLVCKGLSDILCATEVQKSTKAGLLLLTHLFAKDVIPLGNVAAKCHSPGSTVVFDKGPATAIEKLLLAALQWVSRADLASVVGQLVTVILNKAEHLTPSLDGSTETTRNEDLLPPWARPLQEVLLSDRENADAYRSHIFPVLFKRSVPQYVMFLLELGLEVQGYSQPEHNEDSSPAPTQELLYAALQVGKTLGLVEDTTSKIIAFEDNRLLLPVSYTSSLVSSSDRAARVAGLSLLVTSAAATKPYEPIVLEQLKRNLSHLHADTDSNFRSELFSLIQRSLDRLRASSAAVARLTTDSAKATEAKATFSRHKAFLQWYVGFLVWELRPTASYQRHISGLKCLLLVLRSGVDSSISVRKLSKSASGNVCWPFDISIVDDALQRLLLDLLMDPFDDVRQTAAALLDLSYSRDEARPLDVTMLNIALQRATGVMLSSGRADHADGVAHMSALSYSTSISPAERNEVHGTLLVKTEKMLRVGESNLGQAVEEFPLHGLLTSIRYVFLRLTTDEGRMEDLTTLYELCKSVWNVVRPALCNDAPEGHLPDDIDETAELSSKDLLSYCWRALKEASLLMGALISPAVLATIKDYSTDPLHTNETFKLPMIDLCFRQLAELRHRGAFSTVAQTWVSCCSLMVEDLNSPLSLRRWYERTLKLLSSSTAINTRRSAGLPSLLCGILVAARSNELFERAYTDLEAIARVPVDSSLAQGDSLTQVHAMNCMKDILKNTKLAEQSERYVPVALRLAADSLRSDAWAIRNCGLMLFRAVIDRLLGTNDSYLDDGLASSRRVDFEQQPELLELVTGLLVSSSTDRNEGVFPALQFLQRAILPSSRQAEVKNSVFALTKSPSWHVRDKAARTYISYVPVADTAKELERLLIDCEGRGQNAEHGALLSGKYLLLRLQARVRKSDAEHAGLVEQCCDVVEKAAIADGRAVCPYNVDAFGDMLAVASQLTTGLTADAVEGEGPNQDSGAVRTSTIVSQAADLGSMPQMAAMERIHNAADADVWLESRALHLDQQPASDNSAWEEWSRAVETALKDDSVFSREVAARALAGVRNLWQRLERNESAQPLFRRLCFTTYDLLNDDDEDVRILAATTSCRILAAHSGKMIPSLVPLVASQKLIQLIMTRWPSLHDLAETTFARAFPATSSPASHHLERQSQDSYALFAEEKQNLYIDEAREIRIWSHVCAQLAPVAVPTSTLTKLAHWTTDALATLANREDGPLGLSSKAETFILGLQVFAAVEVLLALVEKGARIPIKPSELKKGLVDLLGKGRGKAWSVLWIREVERVLEAVALQSMRTSLGIMGKMGDGLESDVHLGLL